VSKRRLVADGTPRPAAAEAGRWPLTTSCRRRCPGYLRDANNLVFAARQA